MDIIEMMQRAAERAAEMAETARPPSVEGPLKWRPSEGVKWLWNPAALCPWCDTWVPTRRVWALQEVPAKVLGVWRADGSRIPLREQVHPHVFDNGGVCTGDGAVDVMTALWAGLNPWSPASGTVEDWLKGLGHGCENLGNKGKMGARWRAVTEREREEEPDEDQRWCARCEDDFHVDNGSYCERSDNWYCDDCWSELHDRCESCEEPVCRHHDEYLTTVVNARGREHEWCDSCRSDDAFYCEGCDRDLTNDQCEEDSTCKKCWAAAHFTCQECGEEKENDEKFDPSTLVCNDCCFECPQCEDDCTPDEMSEDGKRCKECFEAGPSQAELEAAGQLRIPVPDPDASAGPITREMFDQMVETWRAKEVASGEAESEKA